MVLLFLFSSKRCGRLFFSSFRILSLLKWWRRREGEASKRTERETEEVPFILFLSSSLLPLFSSTLHSIRVSISLITQFRMIDFSRVQKELQECSRDIESSGIRVTPKSENLSRLTGTIPGPMGTPYEGGTFQIDISLPGIYTNSLLHSSVVCLWVQIVFLLIRLALC